MRSTYCLLLLACCGDDSNKHVDAGPVQLAGEYVDWDATEAAPCGIFMATITAHGDPGVTESTPPNGRLNLALPTADTQLDITAPTDPSECLLPAGQTYANP